MSSAPTFMLGSPCSRIDPEIMFPASCDTAGIELAKQTCGRCKFRVECQEWALDPASRCDAGVFGALSEDERKALIKDRNLGKAVRLHYGKLPPKPKRIPAVA